MTYKLCTHRRLRSLPTAADTAVQLSTEKPHIIITLARSEDLMIASRYVKVCTSFSDTFNGQFNL